MKRIAIVSLVALMMSLPASAFAADVPDRPAGVDAQHWVPISGRLGLVLVQRQAGPVAGGAQPLLLGPPVNGFFMVKGAAGWSRLVIVEPAMGPGGAG